MAITGTVGNDVIDQFWPGRVIGDPEEIDGLGGHDRIYGYGGDDALWGGLDNDTLNAGAGEDYLDGEAGSDRLFGGLDNDALIDGSAGDGTADYLDGGEGNYYLYSYDASTRSWAAREPITAISGAPQRRRTSPST